MSEEVFPFYTQKKETFIKHVARDKSIVVKAYIVNPEIQLVDWVGMTTCIHYDNFKHSISDKISKARFDTERAQVIARLISA
jgi:hypothetical protein